MLCLLLRYAAVFDVAKHCADVDAASEAGIWCSLARNCGSGAFSGVHCDAAETLLDRQNESANAPFSTQFTTSITIQPNQSLGTMLAIIQQPKIRRNEQNELQYSEAALNFDHRVRISKVMNFSIWTPAHLGHLDQPPLVVGMVLSSINGTVVDLRMLKHSRGKHRVNLARVTKKLRQKPVRVVFTDEVRLFRSFVQYAGVQVLTRPSAEAEQAIRSFCVVCSQHEQKVLRRIVFTAKEEVGLWRAIENGSGELQVSRWCDARWEKKAKKADQGVEEGEDKGEGEGEAGISDGLPPAAHLPPGTSITGFFHVTVDSPVWAEVVSDQLAALRRGPLYGVSSALVATVLGTGPKDGYRPDDMAKLRALLKRHDPSHPSEQSTAAAAAAEANTTQVTEAVIRELLVKDPKVRVAVRSTDPTHFEAVTLTQLKRFCDDESRAPNALVYYFHSKGVSRWRDSRRYVRVTQWRRFMQHFLLEKPEYCATALLGGVGACSGTGKSHGDGDGDSGGSSGSCSDRDHTASSTCGVNFFSDRPHFGGNFWWARCDYIRTLPYPTPRCWTCGEMWVNSKQRSPFSGVMNLCNSKVDHYMEDYPVEKWPNESFIDREFAGRWLASS